MVLSNVLSAHPPCLLMIAASVLKVFFTGAPELSRSRGSSGASNLQRLDDSDVSFLVLVLSSENSKIQGSVSTHVRTFSSEHGDMGGTAMVCPAIVSRRL